MSSFKFLQLVGELPIIDGDGRKVGYYTGIIVRTTFSLQGDMPTRLNV